MESDRGSQMPESGESRQHGDRSQVHVVANAPLSGDAPIGTQTWIPAGVLRRGCAHFIDLAILSGTIMVWTTIYETNGADDFWLKVMTVVYVVLYFPLLEGTLAHGTIGKIFCGLRVVRRDGVPVNIGHASLRHGLKLLFAALSLFLVWFSAGFHPRKWALHDIVSRAQVVRFRKPG